VIPLIQLAVLGAVALAALVQAMAAAGAAGAAPPLPPLDASLPDDVRQGVTAAFQTEQQPSKLQAFASKLQNTGYPLAAAALESRAAGSPPLSSTDPMLNYPLVYWVDSYRPRPLT
jgi:hypothetical protein